MRRFSRIVYRSYSYSGGIEQEWLTNPHGVAWQPLVDVYERPEAMVIVVELPGIEKTEIDVTIDGASLCIKGIRHKELPSDTRRVHQMEIAYGPFARTVELPGYADLENIQAHFENGYLTVTVPHTAGK
jgi:HSP20 family protein